MNEETNKHKSVVELPLLLLEIINKLGTLMTFPSVIGGLQNFVILVSNTFDHLQCCLIAQEKSTKKLAKRVDVLERVSSQNKLAQLRLDFNNLERQSSRLNIEIHGVPKTQNEDLMGKMNDLATKLDKNSLQQSRSSAKQMLGIVNL